jgi:hypothetical protein
MTYTSRNAAVLFVIAAVLMPAGAQAQWYSSAASPPPLYPYAVRADRPYAVEVAPNTYVIRRPAARRQSHLQSGNADVAVAARGRGKTDPALIDELRNRPKVTRPVVETTTVVREKPVVIETKRYVDDPPRVIERYNVVDDKVADGKVAEGKPARARSKRVATAETGDAPVADKRKGKDEDEVKRVINAEAEITILGPDRMSIRLYRKGSKANASAD